MKNWLVISKFAKIVKIINGVLDMMNKNTIQYMNQPSKQYLK